MRWLFIKIFGHSLNVMLLIIISVLLLWAAVLINFTMPPTDDIMLWMVLNHICIYFSLLITCCILAINVAVEFIGTD